MTRSNIQDCRVFFGGVLFFSTLAVSYPAFSQIKPVDARVDSVLAMMTLEEKVGQMNQYNGFWDATGPQPTATDAAAKVNLLSSYFVERALQEYKSLAYLPSKLAAMLLIFIPM